jgi:tripartite ATP-independent transporter DctP family solute receptor
MTKVSAASLSNFAPDYQVTSIPYLFRDREHLFAILEGTIGKELLLSSSEFLLRGLCFYDAGARSFYSKNNQIKSPVDLKGMKIRTMNDQMSVDMVNTLGGSATPMAYGELYTALQQNVVDGAENNIPSFVTSNHYEVCKYYSFDEHTMVPDVVVIGTRFWETLNDMEKIWVQEAADESVAKQKRYWEETVAENMKVLEKANVQFLYPDKSEFSKRAIPILENMMKDEKMRAIIEKIRSE